MDIIDNDAAESAAEGYTRIALGVEYKGARYRGWQRQSSGVPSVQQKLEEALSRVADSPITVLCAGRTDAGVHASGQVVHFDTQAIRDERAWTMGTNFNLPHDISVAWAQAVPQHFHARFKAMARRYRYVIYNDPVRPAHLGEEVTWNHRPLDIERMAEAAEVLLGTHDFSAFRASQCQAKSPVKHIYHLRVTRHGRMIVLDIRATAFLHHMVRNIAGVLMAIGSGERPVAWIREVLEGRDRRHGGVTAHPYGLYLVQVEYPEEFVLPSRYIGPHFLTGYEALSADAPHVIC
ncbi:tRNA pseudouridine(38-40) synthase TruA [Pseudomonas capeferrum]|uniref:tRNA pseudouridine(38-40) synthase TruA n=1 Tax=Pseudomonas capeferrum TaxID=1495066 RepID=UPI0015E35C96|nr:tRNA pseudouridine(38-40) synthase TruA [Pseudomonas capeferrum]MBA1202176.1 tRNA pseudouridine(38-40) synthase TruA [Pseudomonas capeferrum]